MFLYQNIPPTFGHGPRSPRRWFLSSLQWGRDIWRSLHLRRLSANSAAASVQSAISHSDFGEFGCLFDCFPCLRHVGLKTKTRWSCGPFVLCQVCAATARERRTSKRRRQMPEKQRIYWEICGRAQ